MASSRGVASNGVCKQWDVQEEECGKQYDSEGCGKKWVVASNVM